ncbi:tRNA uridine-5-carboxymethylaminomethyl(34) synthesis GTPase MnmE [Nordella sp. HKS 07]|uniref:tRNA uridine-5-carboxymethylaminomethyl(34) synthesis GTPase MnmE n=1 Tax=Nordella sp. HKS 07 TaxID=2712222 RepID=UPI0013E0EB42|nr:tRNA uridine-5-carboxymethylaminomethyl(34) synthesis GTPase MnmE [Nordella sp. HKS 07]QIG48201.1 tRNA uridine-5-carboxymethylaminomethyl(34) synthesis GTPase MnmE [Nordella sp. HKS 07]
MSESSTIFALSSGSGMAGIAVIRLSGAGAFAAARSLAGVLPAPRQAARRAFRHPQTKDILDDGLLLVFPGPHSFTGEDVAEFHLHGSLAVVRAVLEALGGMAGLRLAEPGEFTRRAFRNGRMDLVAAEGIGDLIRARTERQRKQALHHALGGASQVIETWRRDLIAILGRVEAAVDFSDEADVARATVADVRRRLDDLIGRMRSALAEADRAQALRDGLKVVLAGPPNVGKSSLLNRLAQREAAIVSAIPGTTRDVIEVAMEFSGVPVILTDTAGLRASTEDEIERIGMDRTGRELAGADIIVWMSVPDSPSGPPPDLDSETLWIENKTDLAAGIPKSQAQYRISAKTGAGMAEFFAALEDRVLGMAAHADSAVLIRSRHKQISTSCVENLLRASAQSADHLELMAEALRAAAYDMGRLTGRIDVEDVLDSIFRDFCIGK